MVSVPPTPWSPRSAVSGSLLVICALGFGVAGLAALRWQEPPPAPPPDSAAPIRQLASHTPSLHDAQPDAALERVDHGAGALSMPADADLAAPAQAGSAILIELLSDRADSGD